MHHCTLIRLKDGPLAGKEGEEPEFEGYTSMGTQLGIWDSLHVTSLANECDRLGLDVNEAGWTVGLVMECYEKGLLSGKQVDGIELKFGSVEAARILLNKITYREGIGNTLAEGAMRAAQTIGRDAPSFAVHTMAGNTPLGHDHRPAWNMLFDISVANTGCYELHLSPRASNMGLKEPDPNSADDVARWVAAVKWNVPFFDSLGICRLPNREFPDLLVRILNAATGWDFTVDEAKAAGYRAINLLRAYNIRHGHKPQYERPSPRYGSIPVDGPHKGRNVAPLWDGMLELYYREMGWDLETGKPFPETLRKYGLDFTLSEMWPTA